jgi:hypothetical protein
VKCAWCGKGFKEVSKHQTLCPPCKNMSFPAAKRGLLKIWPRNLKVFGVKKCPICLRDFEMESPQKKQCRQCRAETKSKRMDAKITRMIENEEARGR